MNIRVFVSFVYARRYYMDFSFVNFPSFHILSLQKWTTGRCSMAYSINREAMLMYHNIPVAQKTTKLRTDDEKFTLLSHHLHQCCHHNAYGKPKLRLHLCSVVYFDCYPVRKWGNVVSIQTSRVPAVLLLDIRHIHFLQIFIARKLTTGLTIRFVSLNIIETNMIVPKPNTFTETRTQDSLWVCNLSSHNLTAETNNFLCAVLLSCLISKLQKTSSSRLELRTVFRGCSLCSCKLLFETNNFDLGAVLLSCLVSKLQEPPSSGLEFRTLFRSFNLSVLFCSSQGISMLSLEQISASVLEIELNIRF
jgi:hypothetical protein